MAHECPCKECDAGLRDGAVSVLPHAAIQSIQVACFPSKYSYWQAAANDFAISGQVRRNAIPRLRSTQMQPEASHDFIKNKSTPGSIGEGPQVVEKLPGLLIGMTALDRLDQYCSQIPGVSLQYLERTALSI